MSAISGINPRRPVISVVLPVFNGASHIEVSVRSILDQTFDDFELIAINDGSTDSTLEILQSIGAGDSRLVLVSRENRGLVASLNEGIDVARGDWIARMDADDISEPNRFERQLQRLAEKNADICGSWVQFFGATDARILRHAESDEAIKAELLFGAPFAHPSVMMKATLARQLRYDPVWEKCEDYDLWERAARAGWRMTNVPEVLLRYRKHDLQISSEFSFYQQQLSQKIRYRYWEFFLTSNRIGDLRWVREILKLRDPVPSGVDMDLVDSAFFELLAGAHGEVKETIFHHMTKLYLRGAARCPDMIFRWSKVNKEHGEGLGLGVKVQILMLSLFRLPVDSASLVKVKKAYIYFKT